MLVYFFVFTYSEIDICPSISRIFPKLAGRLNSLVLDDIYIDSLCVDGIISLLKSSLNHLQLTDCTLSGIDYHFLIDAIIKIDELKQLDIEYLGVDRTKANSLVKLLLSTETLEILKILDYEMDCNAAKQLVKTMKHSKVKKLVIEEDCEQAVAEHFAYVKDRVTFV